MRLKMMFACTALALSTTVSNAQMGSGGPPTAAIGTPVEPAKALDALLNVLEEEAMGVVKAMPEDKYGFAPSTATFAPSQGEKFDGVRTFAQQATHLAQANYHFAGVLSGATPDRDVKAISKLTTKADIVKALEDSFAFAHKANATVTTANAFLTIKGMDGQNTRATLAAMIAVHGFDHYGQMVEYLRMNGIIPPATSGNRQ